MSSSGRSESIASSASRDIIDISVSSDTRDNNVRRGSSDISVFCDSMASSSIKDKSDRSDKSDSFDRFESRYISKYSNGLTLVVKTLTIALQKKSIAV